MRTIFLGLSRLTREKGLIVPLCVILCVIGLYVLTAGRTADRQNESKSLIPWSMFERNTAPHSSLLTPDGTVKHCVTRAKIRSTFNKPTQKYDVTLQVENRETPDERKNSFVEIYKKHEWRGITHNVDQRLKSVEGSGPSSTLHFTQEMMGVLHTVINELKMVLNKPKIRLLDIPCGDFQWMFRFLVQRNDIDYTGMDIVPLLIDNHKKAFKNVPDWTFIQGDIAEAPPPGQYDLVMTRIMLNHLPYEAVMKTLTNLNKAGRYLLLTTNPGVQKNVDLASLRTFRYRHLNFEIPPISLEPPLCMARDGPPGLARNHSIGLWKLPLHQVAPCSTQRIKIPPSISDHDYFVCG